MAVVRADLDSIKIVWKRITKPFSETYFLCTWKQQKISTSAQHGVVQFQQEVFIFIYLFILYALV